MNKNPAQDYQEQKTLKEKLSQSIKDIEITAEKFLNSKLVNKTIIRPIERAWVRYNEQ